MVNLVVKANVRQACKDMSVSPEVIDKLNEKVERLLKDAIVRAKANGRNTVMGRDV